MLSKSTAFILSYIIAGVISVFIPFCSYSQVNQFNKKQLDYNISIGIFSTLGSEIQDMGYKARGRILPAALSVDYGISNRISLGGYFCAAKNEIFHSHPSVDLGGVTHYIIGARGIYHYDKSQRFDHYIGLMLGYDNQIISDQLQGVRMRTFAYSVFAGTKFQITERVRGFVEVGFGVSLFNIGISIRTNKQKTSDTKKLK